MKPERISEIDGKPLEPWRQHLLDAAAYMEEHGHCKEHFFSEEGGVCLAGALLRTTGAASFSKLGRECEALGAYLNGEIITNWNDRPETTKEMAVNALIGAALSTDRQEGM